jgi:hypothetical protein
MSIVATNPVEQITSVKGVLKPMTWADVFREEEDVERGGLEVSLALSSMMPLLHTDVFCHVADIVVERSARARSS